MNFEETLNLRKQQMPTDVREAHKFCSNNRQTIEASTVCGCFYCCSIFPPAAIEDWCDEDQEGVGQTAMCPKCGIDSVIGSSSNYPIALEFLQSMKAHWF